MKRAFALSLVAALCLAAVPAAGCGGSKTATSSRPLKSTPSGSAPTGSTPSRAEIEIAITGPWVVHGQPEDQYYLSFNPMGTYGMKKAGVAISGNFMISGNDVILVDQSTGERSKLTYVKGPEMMQDRLEGDVTWTRV